MRVDIKVKDGEDMMIRLSDALYVAKKFDMEYPDRFGAYHGVVHVYNGVSYHVYRSRARTLVVREG